MARFVLVHGAWSSGASWMRLAPHLAAHGHHVEAPDLPGQPGDGHDPAQVTLEGYVARIVSVLEAGAPALLVGHSMGGMVVAGVSAARPELVTQAVYVTAFLPQDGQSLDMVTRMVADPGIAPAIRPGLGATSRLDIALAGDILFDDLPPGERERPLLRAPAQPTRPFGDPVRRGPGFARVPRAYIACDRDLAITPALQRAMLAATPCDPVHHLDAGHCPQLTQPKALADILLALAG